MIDSSSVASIPFPDRNRIFYFDRLRITATFAIIVLHVCGQWGYGPVSSGSWKIHTLFQALTRWAVPVFVMISGALALSKEKSIKETYTRNITRLVMAFFFWSCIYALLPAIRHHDFQNILPKILFGHFHMWFLPMIIGLYMIVPLLRPIVQSVKLTRYLLLLSFILIFLIPQAVAGLKLISPHAAASLSDLADTLKIHPAHEFLFYFVAGLYLHQLDMKKWMRITCCLLGLLGFAMTCLLTEYASAGIHHNVGFFYESFTINVLLEAIGIFVFFKYHCDAEAGSRLIAVSKYCLGIYLVHMYCVSAVHRIGLENWIQNPLLLTPVFSAAVFGLALCISWIGSRIPVIKKCMGH